jgi:Uma2 family endonuclease
MATVLRIGPADHGRPMTYEDYLVGDYEEGCQYELIDGKLYVSPVPNPAQNLVERWVIRKFDGYVERHSEVINFVTDKARVLVPERLEVTAAEPDLAAYHNFPLDLEWEEIRWEDYNPILVGEVLSREDPGKDLVRNVELYLQVPTIKEYWIFDPRKTASRPTMLVYRRRGQKWQRPIELAYGETYTTKLLPDFKLLVDPRR